MYGMDNDTDYALGLGTIIRIMVDIMIRKMSTAISELAFEGINRIERLHECLSTRQ
jgi:hypothetical protein